MGRLSRMMLLLGIVFSILTPILVIQYTERMVNQEEQVVAVQAILPYTKITKEMVAIKKIPKGAVPEDSFHKVEEIIGKFSRTHIGVGHVLQQDHIAKVEHGDSQAVNVTDQKDPYLRGFLLPLAIFQSKKAIEVGDKVDLIAIYTSKDRGSVGDVIGSGIPILAITLPENGYETGTVMVGVKPDLATKLAFILKSGSLYATVWPYDGKAPEHFTQVDMTTFERPSQGGVNK